MQAAQLGAPIRLRSGRPAAFGEPTTNQRVDRMLAGRDRRLNRQLVGPVTLVNGALRDPTLQHKPVALGELLVGIRRWHDFVLIPATDPLHQIALPRPPGHEGLARQSLLAHVQPQLALAVTGIGSVAGKAVFRQDRPHVAIEHDLLRHWRLDGDGGGQGKQRQEETRESDSHSPRLA